MNRRIKVDGKDTKYLIYDNGQVYSEYTNKFLTPLPVRGGYWRVKIRVDGKTNYRMIHRLVLEHFNPVDNQDELQVNHRDGNKSNNTLENLEWTTPSENIIHAYKNGLKSGEALKKPVYQLDKDTGEIIAEFSSQKEAAEKVGIPSNYISAVINKNQKSAGGYGWRLK